MFHKLLRKIIRSFEKDEVRRLRSLSHQAIHESITTQNKLLLDLAVVSYSLCKIIEKEHYEKEQNWPQFREDILRQMNEMQKTEDYKKIEEKLQQTINIISVFDKRFGRYLAWVIHHAKVKRGSNLHYHGLSIGMASKLTGISEWELMDYVGKTKESEIDIGKKRVKERLAYAREVM